VADPSRLTEVSLRRAALRLVAERGYAATTVDDIASAAGVSSETFFQHFADKETAVLFPEGLVVGLVLTALAERPPHEDPVVALVAAIVATFESLDQFLRDDRLLRIGLRVMFREPELRRALIERRISVESEAWAALQRRGVAPDDLRSRVAVATIVTLGFLAIGHWAESGSPASLASALAECLRQAPDPVLLEHACAAAGSHDAKSSGRAASHG
jgi:AcrR family transcriptional regulator